MATSECLEDGSTSIVVFIKDKTIWCANVGDSRCVLSRGSISIALSDDHKPNRPDELKRIQDLGGFVRYFGVWRTQGVLAMSRSIGDLTLKKYVIPTPEIVKLDLTERDEFLVMASDGVWDVLNNQEVVDLLLCRSNLLLKPDQAARAIVTEAFRRGSLDNITVIVVVLKPPLEDSDTFNAKGSRASWKHRSKKGLNGGTSSGLMDVSIPEDAIGGIDISKHDFQA
eukprot:c8133_g1_i1.p2 GENE.c8133_g1_i1~~c8133_g1_i1.p2  ORF type:complete len:226 (-),score=44.59 c8133_g1_i1:135-812(-)